MCINRWMDKEDVYTHTHTHTHIYTNTYTMEHYSAINRNEILPLTTTWIELEGTLQSEKR